MYMYTVPFCVQNIVIHLIHLQVAHRKLAARLLIIFMGFVFKDSHLEILLPLLEQQIQPERYQNVRPKHRKSFFQLLGFSLYFDVFFQVPDNVVQEYDRLLHSLLSLLIRILNSSDVIHNKKHVIVTAKIWSKILGRIAR